MAQTQSTATQQESQTNIYPNANQIATWQNIDATAGGLAQWWINNQGPQATVAGPTDLMSEYWNQVANNAGVPDVSGTQTQLQNVGTQMGQNMAPTSFNIQPGQVSFNNPFANGTPNVAPGGGVSGLASSYLVNPQQVSGPTVSAQQVSAPTGVVNPITGLSQIQAPQLKQYQMGPAQQVNAPNLSNFQMQAAAPVSAGTVTAPQSWTDPGTASQYMSPYTQNVIDTQLAQAQVQEQQQLQQQKSQAAQAGAFGGSREAVEEANTSIGYQQMAANLEAQGLQSAYQQGQQQFNTQQQMQQAQQQFNVQSGLQAALANQQAQQQANVQNLSSFLQTQGLGAQTGLQSQLANQQAGLTVGQANLGANLQTQALGAQLGMQGQLANQSTGLQAALANQQAQEFGAGQQLQASLANQQANLAAAQATAGYNMQGQLANQQAGIQTGLAAQQMGQQGAEFNVNTGLQAQLANQAAQMQALGMQYQGGLQSALQTQNLGLQGQMANAQFGLQGNQLNLANLAQQGNLALQGGNLGLSAYGYGLQGMNQLANAAASNQGYQQQVADTAYQNQMNNMMLPFQALNFQTGVMAQNPSWGQTTTSDIYNQGQTNTPTFNWGQLLGSLLGAAGQAGQGGAFNNIGGGDSGQGGTGDNSGFQVTGPPALTPNDPTNGGASGGVRKGGLIPDAIERFAEGGLAAAAASDAYDDGDQYDTPIPANRQAEYQAWLAKLPPQLRSTTDYDLQGAFIGGAKPSENQHLTDQWKKPNHMTFSDQSQYSGHNGLVGGKWVQAPKNGPWTFFASPTNLKYHSADELTKYFRDYEPGNKLILPATPKAHGGAFADGGIVQQLREKLGLDQPKQPGYDPSFAHQGVGVFHYQNPAIKNAQAYSRITRDPIYITRLPADRGGDYAPGLIRVQPEAMMPEWEGVVSHESAHSIFDKANLDQLASKLAGSVPSGPLAQIKEHPELYDFRNRGTLANEGLAFSIGDPSATDYISKVASQIKDPVLRDRLVRLHTNALAASQMPRMPDDVINLPPGINYGDGSQYAEGGLATLTPRRRLYAPMKRHNYPMVRRHPEEIGLHPEESTGLGGFAYA